MKYLPGFKPVKVNDATPSAPISLVYSLLLMVKTTWPEVTTLLPDLTVTLNVVDLV